MKSWMAGTAGALLAAGLVAQGIALRDTRREVEEMRATVDRLQSKQTETSARSGTAIEEVRDQVARVEKKVAEAKPAAATAAPPPGKEGALPTYLTEEDIQKVVDERLEKAQAKGEKEKGPFEGGDRKMPLHDLARELELDPKVQAKVAEIANGAKRDIFEILKTPKANGTNVADELIDVMVKGDKAGAQQLFQRLFTENIPGTQTTYLAGVGGVQDRARGLLQAAMGTAAYGRYEHMNLHPENIQTGYDPLADYFKQRAGK